MSKEQLSASTGEFQLPEPVGEPAGESENEMLAAYEQSQADTHKERQERIRQEFAEDGEQDSESEAA